MAPIICVAAVVLAIAADVVHASSARAISQQPNIILFVIDDLGFADLSLVGAANRTGGGHAMDYETPNIDTLAREGIMLDAYYVNRLCSPTRTSLLSSRYAYTLGLGGGVITDGFPVALRLNESTIADHLKPLGYQTHGFGKWDIGYHTWQHTPTYRGFDTWLGYYNADEDYFTHSCGGGGCKVKGIDLRNGTEALPNNETYSTWLYTNEALRILEHHNPANGPFFIYGAYQALHGPLEAPQEYLDRCTNVVEHDRHIYCGMAQALDDGIGQITTMLTKRGLADNTVIFLTADNGGQNGVGGNNWPLRGNKATVFEGGVRGNAFVWGGRSTQLYRASPGPRLSAALMHNVDFGPTLVSAGGGNASAVIAVHKLDGMDMWSTLVRTPPTVASTAAPVNAARAIDYGPRTDVGVLLHLQGPNNGWVEEGWELTAALRLGDWKIVVHQTEAPCPSDVNISGNDCLKRATGWVQLHQNGRGQWATRSYVKPTDDQTCDDTLCLFNLRADPLEQVNVAASNADVVARLLARINEYNATRIPNQVQPFDKRACPENFPTQMWTPWLNSTPPLPRPTPVVSTFNSSVAAPPWTRSAHNSVAVTGWCCDPYLHHGDEPNGTDPSTVQILAGPRAGGPLSVVGTALANHTRARLVELGKCPNNDHGFVFDLPLGQFSPERRYTVEIKAIRPVAAGGGSTLLNGGSVCIFGDGSAC